MLSDVRLRVVPIDSVHPHEIADPARERRIERRIREDGILRDPLLVGSVPDVDGYVLLDGTNRLRALRALRVSAAMVQELDYADPRAVELRTWCHAAALPIEEIVERTREFEELAVTPLPPLAAPDALTTPETLALLLRGKKRYRVALKEVGDEGRARVLRPFVDIYEDRMARVDCDVDSLEERGHDARGPNGEPATLVAFPAFTRAQVVAMAMDAAPIPAGITRHIVLRGRALRVNLPLELLGAEEGVENANRSLHAHLGTLQPRVYGEPTILFDS